MAKPKKKARDKSKGKGNLAAVPQDEEVPVEAPQGLQAMSPREAQTYLMDIIKAPPAFEGMETEVYRSYVAVYNEHGRANQRLQHLLAQVEETKAVVQKTAGHLESTANLLIMAEDGRRAKAKGE